jgi:hypothetical protein
MKTLNRQSAWKEEKESHSPAILFQSHQPQTTRTSFWIHNQKPAQRAGAAEPDHEKESHTDLAYVVTHDQSHMHNHHHRHNRQASPRPLVQFPTLNLPI